MGQNVRKNLLVEIQKITPRKYKNVGKFYGIRMPSLSKKIKF